MPPTLITIPFTDMLTLANPKFLIIPSDVENKPALISVSPFIFINNEYIYA